MNDIENFINEKELEIIENNIVKKFTIDIYNENITILIDLLKKEVEQSRIQSDVLIKYYKKKKELIYCFAIKFLEQKKKIQTLSIGFSISYAIYLYYLENSNENELITYLNRRRIPDAKLFAKELKEIYSSICNMEKLNETVL